MNSYLNALNKMANSIKQISKKEELKNIENEIFQNQEAIKLINDFKSSEEDYNFILSHFENDKEKIDAYKKILIDKKRIMDNYPLIKKYNELYLEITNPTLYLENEIKKILTVYEDKIC